MGHIENIDFNDKDDGIRKSYMKILFVFVLTLVYGADTVTSQEFARLELKTDLSAVFGARLLVQYTFPARWTSIRKSYWGLSTLFPAQSKLKKSAQ